MRYVTFLIFTTNTYRYVTFCNLSQANLEIAHICWSLCKSCTCYISCSNIYLLKRCYTLMLRKSRFILHKWLMLYQLMLKIAKHQSLNLQEMSLLSYLYSQLSAGQWWVFVFIGSADTLYLEKGAKTAQLSKIEEWVIFYNWAWHDGFSID